MFGSGVGWYTDAVTGQSLPYLISSGLPTYSLEYKSRASASQPPPGPHRSGDGSGVRTSGSAPASTATISGNKRPVPETSGSAEVLPDPLEQSHPDGCENLSLLSQVASGDDGQRRVGTAHPLHLICEPPSSDGGLDGDQRTQVGSPLRGPATGRVESCDSDGVARSEYTNSRSLVPFVDLSQLSPAGLAQHLAGVAFEDDPPPSVSPRLGVVLHVPSDPPTSRTHVLRCFCLVLGSGVGHCTLPCRKALPHVLLTDVLPSRLWSVSPVLDLAVPRAGSLGWGGP